MQPNALDSITIEGFKSISSIRELRLNPINVIIGPNGSGKSNFIGAFTFLHAIYSGRLQSYVTAAGGGEKILHFGSKTTKQIQFRISSRDLANQYSLNLTPTGSDSLFAESEAVYSLRDEPPVSLLPPFRNGLEAAISNAAFDQSNKVQSWVRRLMAGWRAFHVHDTSSTSPMRKTAKLNDNALLRQDGANLAAFLYLLRQKHIESYNLIQRTIQQVAPFFDDFILEPLRLNPDDILLQWRHTQSDQFFDAASLSDGTLRFIALATLLLQPVELRPATILIDEPELGLHPSAITLLASLIRSSSADTQMIVATQSSLLLDHFSPEDVLVAERRNAGTQLRRLEAAPLAAWLEDYSLGQLWEKNELGGRPSREHVR